MKRIVWSITLVVMLLNSLVTPITYANDAISAVDESPVVEENVVEETTQEGQDEVSEDSLELSDSSDIQEIQGENNTKTNDSTTQETTAKAVTQGNNNEDNTTQNNKENNQENLNQNETSNITETSDEQSWNEAYSEGSKSQGDSSESVSDQIEKSENPTEWTTEPWVLSTISDVVNEIITAIKYFFVKSSEDYITYTQKEWEDVIILEDPESPEEIIIMDRNLWAESNEIENESSYGNYYQWWNNNGFKDVDETNATSMLAVYTWKYEWVGYTIDNLFRVWNEDIWEEDENWYSSHDELWNIWEEEIQWPCPDWYHIPSKDEWNKLVSTWIKIHTVDEEWNIKSNSSVDWRIDSRLTECWTWNNEVNCIEESSISGLVELFMNELKLPKAWNYNANWEREENVWVYWTRTPWIDSYKSEVFSIGRLFGEEYSNVVGNRANGNSLRCFLNVKKDEKQESKIDVVLNALEITWTATYDNVTVNVIAPIWSFKEWTTLEIRAIENEVEVKNVEDTIVNKVDEIEKKPVFVAFDISFIDPDTKQEVQPLSWSVSVSFDYKANQSLMVDEEKNVSVYHINDKDENWEELKNEDEIKVDKVENIEIVDTWVIQTDVYNFSVYVLTLSENSGIVITLDPNWGTFVGNSNITVDENGIWTIVSSWWFIQLPAVYKDGYYLEWWYNWEDIVWWIFDEIEVSESITLSGIWEESDCSFVYDQNRPNWSSRYTNTKPEFNWSDLWLSADMYRIKWFGWTPTESCLNHFVIPETYNWKKVVAILESAFENKGISWYVAIPDNIYYIYKKAFYNNIITSLTIWTGLKYINESAFEANKISWTLELPNVLWMWSKAFYNNQIERLILWEWLVQIWSSAFEATNSTAWTIKYLSLPSSIKDIFSKAFYNQKIENPISLPSWMNRLWWASFMNNNIPWRVTIPYWDLNSTANDAFKCNLLTEVVFSDRIEKINPQIFDTNGCKEKKTLTSVYFWSNIKEIWVQSFRWQKIQWVLDIPESVEYIRNAAFENNNISTIKFNWNTLKEIEGRAFNAQNSDARIEWELIIPDSVTHIWRDSSVAFNKQNIDVLRLWESTTYVWKQSFDYNSYLKYVDLKNVEIIEDNAFRCTSLKSVYLPETITTLGFQSFEICGGYTITKKDSLDYTWAYISPIIQLYTYTFVDEEGHILWTWYYPEIQTTNTTKLIPLDYYRWSWDIADFEDVDSLITPEEWYVLVWSTWLSENDIVTQNRIW